MKSTGNSDEFFMQRALELAMCAGKHNEVPVGAVVVIDNAIVGEGYNQPISSSDPSAHAEIIALRNAAKAVDNYRLINATLYVTIEPCTMCAGAMVHARIKRLVYGATETKAGVAESNGCLFLDDHLNHIVELNGGVLKEQCSSVMADFFVRRRNEKKNKK